MKHSCMQNMRAGRLQQHASATKEHKYSRVIIISNTADTLPLAATSTHLPVANRPAQVQEQLLVAPAAHAKQAAQGIE